VIKRISLKIDEKMYFFSLQNKKKVIPLHPNSMRVLFWRNGRAVECGGLENR
jgi:hypothetical protein